jgi:Sigma-70 region 2.
LALTDYEASRTQLATDFYILSENIVRFAKFNIDPDDAIQEGVVICFEKIERFEKEKGRAFAYLTTCIFNHFKQIYRTTRNYNELKKKYYTFKQSQVGQIMIKNGKEYQLFRGKSGFAQ